MKYKLIEDKNGTIVIKEKRYKMSKLEYTKDDLIDIQNDYDLLYKKLDHYNKIINTQALEIARLKEQLEYLRSNEYLNQVKWERTFNEELVKDLQQKIDKAIEYIKEHNIIGMNKEYLPSGIEKCYGVELLAILGEKENVKN